jgi:hypothetical protein
MALVTASRVEEYFSDGGSESDYMIEKAERIMISGITYYVYRATFMEDTRYKLSTGNPVPRSVIVKYAAEYTTSNPPTKLPVSRQWYEKEAPLNIQVASHATSETAAVRVPRVLTYDQSNAVLIMEDVAPLPMIADAQIKQTNSWPTHTRLKDWLVGMSSDTTKWA